MYFSQNGCQIRSHQKLCFGIAGGYPNMTSCCHTQLRTQVIAVSMLGQTSLNMQQLDVMRTYAAIKTEQ